MKYISFFGSVLLFATLTACGSGSSNEPASTTSTNTIPPENSTTDGGTSSEPSSDQPTGSDDTENADDSDDGGLETGGDSGQEANTDGSSDDSSSTTDGSDDLADDATNIDGGTDVDSGADDSGGNSPDEPAIDPDSALGQIQSRIKLLTGRTLLALNQSLSQGEMLTAQQEQCLGTYDPAIGEPLLAIECEQPLATGEVEIFASVASFTDTPECRTSLQNANADACAVDQAQMIARPIFTMPETGRPQPTQDGAMLSYNIVQDRLTIENIDPPLIGIFFCEYDLSNGNAIGGDPGGNCFDQLIRIADLIDEHLAVEH